ncbi:MAG TPA: sugar-binding protein [Candidatus Baltobacteraceae bacterium]|nr:sugar-binding protein [Candidatus Baltobacteraceae bacterium]
MVLISRCACAVLFAVLTATAYAGASEAGFAIAVPVLEPPPGMSGAVDQTWSKAAQAPVLFDFTYQRPGEPTTAYIGQDKNGLDVAFNVTQHEPLTASAQTNGPAVLNDDSVTVVLWPQGANGFSYTFTANAVGARYQTSSENTAYTPQWTAAAKRSAGGYTVTMHIPFRIIRSAGSKTWNVQFERNMVSSNSVQVWEHAQGQRNAGEVAYAGTLTGIAIAGGAQARPRPRLQTYALGESTTPQFGGSTSRIGADLAIPVTATSSFLASFHPDYSNLEVDQQTIAPTAYARRYSEVRPFFTQGANNFNDAFSCTNCPTTLYTPSIPTFREGYAYEGTAGPLAFGAFDAIGMQRTDAAQVLTYQINDPKTILSLSAQRVAVNTPDLSDDTSTIYTGYENRRTHLFIAANYGVDSGTNTTAYGQGQYYEYDTGFVNQTTTAVLSLQKVGASFDPVDGYVQQPDVNGYFLVFNKTFNFSSKALLHDISMSSYYGRYHNRFGFTNQTDGGGQINFDFRNLMTLHVFAGSSSAEPIYEDLPYLPFPAPYELLPFNSNGFFLGYKTQTSTPSGITYSAGTYFHGRLTSWSYTTTVPLRRGVNLSLEADSNQYAPVDAWQPEWQKQFGLEPAAMQWLERASIDWQFNRNASFDLGIRRIIGRNIPNAYQFPDLPAPPAQAPCSNETQCYAPFDYVNAGNVSAAFHLLAAHNEFYVVYGNPNSLSTYPALYVKWIRYLGAEKGT